MNETGSATENAFRDALATIQKTVDKYRGCSSVEKEKLRHDLNQLRDMEEKLTHGHVEIVIFGEISTGKSALINALLGKTVAEVDVQGGWTKEARRVPWTETDYVAPGLGDSRLILVDTPGINEVGDSDHETIAKAAAKRGDLILFVADSDLNEVEFSAILALAAVHKPILIVINKIDLYDDEELDAILRVLRNERLKDLIPPENIVTTAADPREIEYVQVLEDGREINEWRKPEPDIVHLKSRILEILAQDGSALVALNAAMYAADKTDRIAKLRVELRDRQANQTIASFAAIKALAVALNPAPIVDVIGGSVVDVTMVATLAQVYGLEMSWNNARKLARSILIAAGWVTAAEIGTHLLIDVFKTLTIGTGTVLTAVPQGAAAGYGSYIVGKAAKHYLEHGASWGPESPKDVIRRILAETDRQSVLDHLKDEITKKIHRNAYSEN